MNFVVVMWCFLCGVGGLIHIFVCKGKNQSECAENIRHHHTVFGCLGDQVPTVCAALV